MKRPVILVLLAIFALAFFLRVIFLSSGALTFGYDQARDALSSLQIVHGHLKVLGPPSSTPGLFHGVFYYYFLAPAYLVGRGSPLVAAYWTALWNAAVVFVVFALGLKFTKSLRAGLLSAFIFAISFEASQYAVWLSNPTLGMWTIPLTYLGLWVWVKEKKWWGSALCGLFLGLSVQSEIFLAYHTPVILLWLWVGRKNVTKKSLLQFAAAFGAAISTMLLAEIKFGFKGLSGVANLANSQDAIVSSRSLGDFIVLYLNQIGKVFAYSTYPGNIGYGGILVLVLIILGLLRWKKSQPVSWEPFLATWLFSHITIVSVGGTSTPFLNVGFAPAIALLLGCTLSLWWGQKRKALVVALTALLILGNISRIYKDNPHGQTIFSIQRDMTLKNQLAAIDYTYQSAGTHDFSINTITSPLWINIVWTYLYKWYGQEHYGYVPLWHGPDQVGQLDTLTHIDQPANTYFLIQEPLQGIPGLFVQQALEQEDGRSRVLEEKHFGQIVVQKRAREDKSAK